MRHAAVAVLVATACGSGGAAPDAAPPDGGISLPRAPAAYAGAFCERVFACCTAPEIADRFDGIDPAIDDLASCQAYAARVFGNEFVADTLDAEAAGHARYLPEQMGECVDHLRADDCVHLARVLALMALPADCPRVHEPFAAVGDGCNHDFQCTTSYCLGGTENADGACAVLPGLGDPCPESRCVDGAFCDRSVDPAGRCTTLAANGDACTSRFGCASFYCDSPAPGEPGVCATPTTCDGT